MKTQMKTYNYVERVKKTRKQMSKQELESTSRKFILTTRIVSIKAPSGSHYLYMQSPVRLGAHGYTYRHDGFDWIKSSIDTTTTDWKVNSISLTEA